LKFAGQPGATKSGEWAQFATPEAGAAAMASQLLTYQTRAGINTVGGIISKWAPSSDGNNVAAYAGQVDPHLVLPRRPRST